MFTRAMVYYSSSLNGGRTHSEITLSRRLNMTLVATTTPVTIPKTPQINVRLSLTPSLSSIGGETSGSSSNGASHQMVKISLSKDEFLKNLENDIYEELNLLN